MKKRITCLLVFVTLIAALPICTAAQEDLTLSLKNQNAELWIDRINVPTEIKEIYDLLVEGSDNDGENDFLIEDQYFDGDNTIDVSIHVTLGDGEQIQDYYTYYYKCISAVVDAFDRDHPEVFWLDLVYSIRTQWRALGKEYDLILKFTLQNTEKEIDVRAECYKTETAIQTAIEKRNTYINEILSDVNNKDNYEKLKHFNNVLTKKNEYNRSADLNVIPNDTRECISALEGRTGEAGPVCEAYARAFKVLCDKASIPCVLVDGMAKSKLDAIGSGHMWNYVKMDDDQWYAVDVTWNDPVVYGISGAVSGFESEKWFLLHSKEIVEARTGMTFIESHPVSNSGPTATINFTNGPLISNEKYEPNLTLTNNLITVKLAQDKTANLILATYGENDILIDIKIFDVTGKVNKTISETGIKTAGAKTLKAFVWEKNSQLMPIYKSKTVNL